MPVSQQTIIYVFVETGMFIITYRQAFFFIHKGTSAVKRQSLLVKGCHIYNTKRLMV